MKLIDISTIFLRLALATGFLSAVAARFNLWGKKASTSEAWSNFVRYTADVNSFLPKTFIPTIAVIATILEIAIAFLLLFGYKTNYAALGAAILLLFALAMAYSYGIKEPLDYSVFAASAGALLLAAITDYKWSIDQLFAK
ncbi:MAG: DoxX protein [Bacteroidetes bacterium]|nr:DoxX protein [Bacteroidota bacterium]